MTETFYRTGTHNNNHTTFGGIINQSDFNTDYRGKDNVNGSSIAIRIVSDWRFDKKCKENLEARERNKKYGK